MRKSCCLTLLSLFIFFSIKAQVLPFERYTSKNGLIADRITAIAQDAQGFMWFGSYFGICRYDGQKFEKINLPFAQQNKYVNFLKPAGKKMYAGFLFNGGLAEIVNQTIKAYFISGKEASASEFTCMYANDEDSLYLCNTQNQLYQFTTGRFTYINTLPQPAPDYAKAIEKDRWNNLWIATGKGLLVSPYPYKTFVSFFKDENIVSLTKGAQKEIWVCRDNGKGHSIETYDGYQNNNLVGKQFIAQKLTIKPIAFSGNMTKGFWCINVAKQLIQFNAHNKEQLYQAPVEINNDITTIFCDRENNIWIANEPGVVKMANFKSQSFLFNEMAAGGGAIFQSDTTIWATNAKSLYTINDTIQKQIFPLRQSDYLGVVHVDREKNVWISMWGVGIWCMKQQQGKLIPYKYYSRYKDKEIKVQKIVEDSQGNIWLAGINGLFHIVNGVIVDACHPLNAKGNPCFITCISLDEKSHSLWIGDNAQGVVKINYRFQDGKTTYTQSSVITAQQGLNDEYTRSIFYDQQDNVWIGTRYGGIYRAIKTANGYQVINETAKAGLTCTRVTDIAQGGDNVVWFATCDGVYQYRYPTNEWKHYTTADGLLNAEVFNVYVDNSKQWLWILTAQGITKMHLGDNETSVPPLVHITSVNVLGKPDTSFYSKSFIQFNNRQNSIGFTFVGTSFIDERNVHYKYMLQGFDKSWSEQVKSNSVNYASLPPGKYTFKVLAENAKGQWSLEPASFSFEIILPFYKRTWFFFLVIISAFYVVYFMRMQRLKQRYKIEKIRLSIARDLHDDVGTVLGSINILSKTATRKLQKAPAPQEISTIFQKIGQSAENTLEAMDDIVWAINPDKDKLEDLIIRMREYAIPMLEVKNINFHFDVAATTGQTIAMHLRRNLFLVFKEAIHNILKHAQATNVHIQLCVEHNNVVLSVKDDGIGFDTGTATNRNGLKNMYQRAAASKGALTIKSTKGGSNIIFSAPIR